MFQDIGEHQLDIAYLPSSLTPDDYLVAADEKGRLLMVERDDIPQLAKVQQIEASFPALAVDARYLFAIDDRAVFLAREAPDPQSVEAAACFAYHELFDLRNLKPDYLAFAAATAAHLIHWYANNRFCGHCGAALAERCDERALYCPDCGLVIYPRINPVVIVGVCDGDRLLLTRYAQAPYNRHALVAGFVEIGETFEDAIRREVMEEVGLAVTDIRYFASQPWAFSDSLLAGFFAEVSGSVTPVLDDHELAEALWFDRAELPYDDTTFSLTWTLVEAFRDNRN
jgi:NAD+ diphosphatase